MAGMRSSASGRMANSNGATPSRTWWPPWARTGARHVPRRFGLHRDRAIQGLISSTSYSAVAAGDTMSSHAGWLEAGGTNAPTYTGNRKTAVWSGAASGAKALSAALSFAITGTGTVKGAFVCYGSGAIATKDNTSGTLWSAGTFTTGDKAVVNGDTLNCNYTQP